MIQNNIWCITKLIIPKSMSIVLLILCYSVSFSQSPVIFSGTWIKDDLKSDDSFNSFEIEYSIDQTQQSFMVRQKLTHKSSHEFVIREYSFSLDGKVTNTEKEYGTEKNTIHWSSDKKTLTTRTTVTYGNDEVGFTEIYTLSDDGLFLTTQKSDIISDTLSVTQIFNKKL